MTAAEDFVLNFKKYYDLGMIQLRPDAPEKVRIIFQECLDIAVDSIDNIDKVDCPPKKYDVLEVLKMAHKCAADAILTFDNHGEHVAANCMCALTGILWATIKQIQEDKEGES